MYFTRIFNENQRFLRILYVVSSKINVVNVYEVRGTGYEVRGTRYGVRGMGYEVRGTKYEARGFAAGRARGARPPPRAPLPTTMKPPCGCSIARDQRRRLKRAASSCRSATSTQYAFRRFCFENLKACVLRVYTSQA